MIAKQLYEIKPLPIFPIDAQFTLGGIYAKEVDDILYTWSSKFGVWTCTDKTLSEYNTYYVKEPHEYDLRGIIKDVMLYGAPHEEYYIFKNWDEEFYISYIYPKQKGVKGTPSLPKYAAGEVKWADKCKYPQLEKNVGNNIICVKM